MCLMLECMLVSGPSILPSAVWSEKKVQQDTPEKTALESEALPVSEDFRVCNEPPLTLKAFSWMREQIPLAEAFFVAVSLHVVLFPVMWFVGWALPWPKPPVVTVIVEYDLTQWANRKLAPQKIFEVREPRLNP